MTNMPSGSKKWFYVQLAIVSFCGMLSLQGIWKDSNDLETHLDWYAPILILIGTPTMVINFLGVPTPLASQFKSGAARPGREIH